MRCPACAEVLPLSMRMCFACGTPVPAPERRPVVRIAAAAAPVAVESRVTLVPVTLLDRPFAAARPVMSVPARTPVTVLAEQAGFVHVETTAGRRGYVVAARVGTPADADVAAVPPGRAEHAALSPEPAMPDDTVGQIGSLRPAQAAVRGQALAPLKDAVTAAALRLAGTGMRGVRWLRHDPRRAYAAAGAMLLAAMLIAVVRAGAGEAPHDQTEVSAGAGLANTPTSEQTPARATPALAIAFPPDGADLPSPIRIETRVQGVSLKLPSAGDPYASHLHYFLDTDPAVVVGPGQPVPMGIPGIFHSDARALTVSLTPGPHTVWVVLTDNDHVPFVPALLGRVSFTVTEASRTAEAAPLVFQSLIDGKWRVMVMEGIQGQTRAVTDGAWDDIDPAWSPDGTRLVFASNRDGRFHLYSMGAQGGEVRRLTDGDARDRTPAWSPDGRWIAFSSDRDGGREQVFVMPAEGGPARQLTAGAGGGAQPVWSPDGARIAFVRQAGEVTQIFVVDAADAGWSGQAGELRQVTNAYQRHIDPAWSPDGRRIAFAAVRENRTDIFVVNLDGSDTEQLTSEAADRHPAWSPDGRRLLFVSGREGAQQIFALDLFSGLTARVTDGMHHSLSPAWPRR